MTLVADNRGASLDPALPAQPLTLRRNFSWTLFGNIVDAVAKAACLVIIARLGTVEMVGQFSLGLAVAAPVVLFLNMQLSALQATDVQDVLLFSEYLGFRLAAMATALSIIAAIAALTTTGPTREIVLLVGVNRALEGIADAFAGLFQKHERMDRTATSQSLRAVALLLALLLALHFGGALRGALLVSGAVSIAILFAYDIPQARRLLESAITRNGASESKPVFSKVAARRIFRLATPLAFVSLLDSLNTNTPRYLLQRYDGAAAVGYYSTIAYFMIAGATVVTALSFSIRPRLARYFATDVVAYKALLKKLVLIGAGLGIAGVVIAAAFGSALLSAVYGNAYGQFSSSLTWVMGAAGLWYVSTCVAVGLTSAREFRVQPFILSGTLLVGGGTCVMLAPSLGVLGASISLFAASAARLSLTTLAYHVLVRRQLRNPHGE